MAASTSKTVADPAAARAGKTVQIEIDELLRTREQLVQGLSNVSNAINEFVRSYVQHTNKWVGAESSLPTGAELAGMANLFSTGTGAAQAPLAAVISAAAEAAVDKRQKKEKKPRKQKDPNAPKRPLTAYFLYTASARPVVKKDFEDNGQAPSAQDVSNEILKRWNEMAEAEKDGWKKIYERNAEKYRAEVKEYLERTGQEASEQALAAHTDDAAAVGAEDDEVPAAAEAPATKSKAKATKSKKKDTSAAPSSAPVEAASPSAQLNARSNVPLPTPSKAADGSAPKSNKRKSAAAAVSEDKTADAAPKKKRKTKAEKDAEASAAAKEPAKEAAADKAAPKQRKRKSTKQDGA